MTGPEIIHRRCARSEALQSDPLHQRAKTRVCAHLRESGIHGEIEHLGFTQVRRPLQPFQGLDMVSERGPGEGEPSPVYLRVPLVLGLELVNQTNAFLVVSQPAERHHFEQPHGREACLKRTQIRQRHFRLTCLNVGDVQHELRPESIRIALKHLPGDCDRLRKSALPVTNRNGVYRNRGIQGVEGPR
jgi:hypothetical protein